MSDPFHEAIAGQFCPLAWAADFERKLPLMTCLADIRLHWQSGKARLKARDPQRFHDLNFKLAQHAKGIS